MRPYLGNRIGIGLVGLALIAGGLCALVARRDHPQARIVDLSFFAQNAWARPLAAGVAMLIALIATRWLVLALGWGRRGSRTGTGIAMLAVALKGIEGIGKIQVRLMGDSRMRVSLSILPHADLHEVISRLDGSAISRVRGALGRADLPALVRLHVRRR